MAEDPDRRAPAEKLIAGSLIDSTGVGRPLSERTLQRERTVESYLRGEAIPRYMQRAAEIERGVREHRSRLGRAYARLRATTAPGDFAAVWEARARAWDFAALNALIAQHNEWYPIERDLAMDPRTGDYVLVHGRSYKRDFLDAGWILNLHPVRH